VDPFQSGGKGELAEVMVAPEKSHPAIQATPFEKPAAISGF